MGWFDNEQDAENRPAGAAPQSSPPRPAAPRASSGSGGGSGGGSGSTLGRQIHIDGTIVCDEAEIWEDEVEKKVEILPISIEDIDKKNWIYRVRITEDRRDWWQNWVLGAGIATALVMSQYSSGDDLKALAAISTMSYSTFRYFQSRKELKGLVEEGKFKGYLDLRFRPETPAAGVTWTYHF